MLQRRLLNQNVATGDATAMAGEVLLGLYGIRKHYGSTVALRGVDFELRAGEVHALLGQNGSGKSTLMKVAYGEISPNAGEVVVVGQRRHFRSPHDARRAGVVAVAQEVPLVEELTVAENVVLGRWHRRGPLVDFRAAEATARRALQSIGVELDVRQPVRRLSPDRRQLVAVARAIVAQASIVVFDEPTSSLGAAQAEALFSIIDTLRQRGIAIAFISQRLPDVARVADRVTVLRNGAVVGSLPIQQASEAVITEMMVGDATAIIHKEGTAGDEARVVLSIEDLSVGGALHGLDLSVREGEVVGLAGLIGAGQQEVLTALYGVSGRRCSGRVAIDGRPWDLSGPRAAVRAGIGFLNGDRRQSLFMSQSVEDNLASVVSTGAVPRPVRRRSIRARADELIEQLRIVPPAPARPASSLSGGNQQKVALGKWFPARPRVLLLEEPTRGVDVGARVELHRCIRSAVARGCVALVSSSDFRELVELCDRVVVLYAGTMVGELDTEVAGERELSSLVTTGKLAMDESARAARVATGEQ